MLDKIIQAKMKNHQANSLLFLNKYVFMSLCLKRIMSLCQILLTAFMFTNVWSKNLKY